VVAFWSIGRHTAHAFDGGVFVTMSVEQWVRDNLKVIPDSARARTRTTPTNLCKPHYVLDVYLLASFGVQRREQRSERQRGFIFIDEGMGISSSCKTVGAMCR